MSHVAVMLQWATIDFHGFPDGVGNYTRHDRDMKKPAAVAGSGLCRGSMVPTLSSVPDEDL